MPTREEWEEVRNNRIGIRIMGGDYGITFAYNPNLVQAIKTYIPAGGRRWDNASRSWIIAGQYKAAAEQALGCQLPLISVNNNRTVTNMLTVYYLGQCKERAPGDVSAMAFLENGGWSAVFPEDVLRAWFEDATGPDESATLYAILGARQSDDDAGIKSAYRRMAKQWHPDVCKEPHAHETFLRIREAYDILSNPKLRARYNAGIQMTANQPKKVNQSSPTGYRSPLRCGYIMCEGYHSIGRLVVTKILSWDDITDNQGRSMVTSWIMGDDKPIIGWA